MKLAVYLETSVISYLTARLSGNLVIAAHQQLTQTWWDNERKKYALHVSQLVIQEAAVGDAEAASKRLKVLDNIPLLELTPEALALAKNFMENKLFPEKAKEDALHIAVATVERIDYLLTWNCRHIANAAIRNLIERRCRDLGYEPPIICTPEELMGDDDVER
jgi:hypothetical protein